MTSRALAGSYVYARQPRHISFFTENNSNTTTHTKNSQTTTFTTLSNTYHTPHIQNDSVRSPQTGVLAHVFDTRTCRWSTTRALQEIWSSQSACR